MLCLIASNPAMCSFFYYIIEYYIIGNYCCTILVLAVSHLTIVTEFAKTDLMGTNTEIHFLPVDESHTHALSRDTKHLRLDGQVCFFRRIFSDAVKPRGCISWPVLH